jgi:LPS-assembly lipoprotein
MSWSESGRRGRHAGLAALLPALLAGCGFQLKGNLELPAGVERVYVQTQDELSPFGVAMRARLDAIGAREPRAAANADAVVRVFDEKTGRRVLSVSSRNTPKEYELYYRIDYAIERKGEEVVPREELSMTRNISFDETQLLAKDREERILREALARDLADLVLRRLAALP